MAKMMYVARMAEGWNEDFCAVTDNLDTMVAIIEDICHDDGRYIEAEDLKAEMLQREKEGYGYLMVDYEGIPEHWGLTVIRVPLNKGVR